MAPPLSSLYTLSFLCALLITLFVGASLRLLAILPRARFQPTAIRRKPSPTRVLVVLGSGGHTHEMMYLLRALDPRTYTHRTYIVSSADSFSAARAREFERLLEDKIKDEQITRAIQKQSFQGMKEGNGVLRLEETEPGRPACVGPAHYDIAVIPRARKIHQSLLTTPFTALMTLLFSFKPLLSATPWIPDQAPQNAREAAARDLPDLILVNGPATAVIVVLASLILRFFNIKGANSRDKCKTVYVESFARVKTLSLSGKLLIKVVDRFIVQWEELEGKGGRAEFWGILV
ncbi:oligosaccharide biosynthesis protein Alg14 like protein [Polyplosphaeria fusca]|uniref:UDP-N-acetylglucosamine transferase subunit ALG14 n=1 Tax=Polyplosphaeria fusca TaxID=682080 RepID=A0A9P4R3D6_9PLEO|nr:oligosaccharide biosynthesis protein Alg14 like protein [Polyplosphaeria fusca]